MVVLQYLLTTAPGVNTKIDALWMAALSGKEGCVRLLIDSLHPLLENDKDFAYQALLCAADSVNASCVGILLPFSTARNTMALKQAAKTGHNSCVEALYGVSDPFEALQQLRSKHHDKQHKWGHLAQLCQKEMILNAINTMELCNEAPRNI